MSVDFLYALLVGVGILYIPGFILLRACNIKRGAALVLAPAPAIIVAQLLAIVFDKLGITLPLITPYILLLVCAALAFLIASSIRGSHTQEDCFGPECNLSYLALYVLFACAVGFFVFIRSIGDGTLFAQTWDNLLHVPAVKVFVDTSNASPFLVNYILPNHPGPYDYYGYYPGAWHQIAASIAQTLNLEASLAANVTSFIAASFIFPSSICLLISTLFKNSKSVLLAGVIIGSGFAAFPWDFLYYGTLSPNLLSFSLLPGVLACFINALQMREIAKERVVGFSLFLVALIAACLSHPNALFSSIFLLAPFACSRLACFASYKKQRSKIFIGLSTYILVACAILAAWIFLVRMPAFHSVVTQVLPLLGSYARSTAQALLLADSYRGEELFALLSLIGAVLVLVKSEYRWLALAFCLCVLQYVLCGSFEGVRKMYASGFWYNDIHRVVVHLIIVSILLGSYSLGKLSEYIGKIFNNKEALQARHISPLKEHVLLLALPVLVFSLTWFVSIPLPRDFMFGNVYHNLRENVVSYTNQESNILDSGEIRFLKEVDEFITNREGQAENNAIVNIPNDGSGFAWLVADVPIYFRSFNDAYSTSASEASQELRLHINEYASNPTIKHYVNQEHIRYVMLLDKDNESSQDVWRVFYHPEKFDGITSITDTTPGFKKVLQEGDMVLYELTDVGSAR